MAQRQRLHRVGVLATRRFHIAAGTYFDHSERNHTSLRHLWYGKISVEFLDGSETYEVEFSWQYIGETQYRKFLPDGYDTHFNLPVSDNYYYEPNVGYHGDGPTCSAPQWTYTFTNSDYDAAVEYLAQQD